MYHDNHEILYHDISYIMIIVASLELTASKTSFCHTYVKILHGIYTAKMI